MIVVGVGVIVVAVDDTVDGAGKLLLLSLLKLVLLVILEVFLWWRWCYFCCRFDTFRAVPSYERGLASDTAVVSSISPTHRL